MHLIDSHCHFDDASFDHDRDEAYRRARKAGVGTQILAGVSASLWPKLKQVVARYPGLYAAYGLHPMYLAEHRPEHLIELERWVETERPVAIGECGLDFFIPNLSQERQIDYFAAQMRIARDHRLPVIIHARRAVDHTIKTVRHFPRVKGVVHSFSGSEQQAKQLLSRGFLLSFGGPVTYQRAQRLRRLIQTLPLEGFLLETDAPDQPGATHRGERNEPAFLPEILTTVAELRDQDPDEIVAATTRNAMKLFGIDPCPIPAPVLKS
jgi:TatD DNase family protein